MLVSTSEASKILGISLQGVHYRIKKGLLKSKKEDGKIFVFIDKEQNTTKPSQNVIINNDELLKAKDEQIELLKEHISWMKEQYQSQINKLEDNQDKIIDVFKSEITLLQQAYHEMKDMHQIENKKNDEILKDEDNIEFMDIKDFFAFMKKNNKTKEQIKKILLNQIKTNDNRFIYNSQTKEVIIYKSDFIDLI